MGIGPALVDTGHMMAHVVANTSGSKMLKTESLLLRLWVGL